RRTGRAVIESQAEQVGLITRLFLHSVGDVASIRRILGAAVIRVIRRRDVSSLRSAVVQPQQPQIIVGLFGRVSVVVGNVHAFFPSGREVVLQRPAELEGWRVVVARGQVPGFARSYFGQK